MRTRWSLFLGDLFVDDVVLSRPHGEPLSTCRLRFGNHLSIGVVLCWLGLVLNVERQEKRCQFPVDVLEVPHVVAAHHEREHRRLALAVVELIEGQHNERVGVHVAWVHQRAHVLGYALASVPFAQLVPQFLGLLILFAVVHLVHHRPNRWDLAGRVHQRRSDGLGDLLGYPVGLLEVGLALA